MPFAAAKSFGLAPSWPANVGLMLLVNGYDRTSYLAVRSIGIHVGTHGSSLGTLDAQLNDPSPDPAMEDGVVAFAGTMQLYEGRVRSLEIDEWKIGTHHFVGLGAQDNGPVTTLPTTAPFGLSDTPNGTTTFGYHSLRKLVRTTEGGSAKTSYEVVYHGYGLWVNMNVQVTSAILGLSATELTIVDAQVRWPNKSVPEFTFTLGTAQVSLEQLLQELPAVGPGAITQTMISDGAVSTPQLAANAVTTGKLDANVVVANVANIGGTVVIGSGGIAVTGGAITITNPTGTVIIDGTSNVFKIRASGTLSKATVDGDDLVTVEVVLSGLGVQATTPAHLSFVSINNASTTRRQIGVAISDASDFVATTSGGAVTAPRAMGTSIGAMRTYVNGSSFAVVELRVTNAAAGSVTFYGYYHVLAEAAL